MLGKKLIGYMETTSEEVYELLFLIDKTGYLIWSENQNWSWYDNWHIEKVNLNDYTMNDTYKSIGEKIQKIEILGIENKDGSVESKQNNDDLEYLIKIKTKTKIIRLGIDWNDCYYPQAIWDVI